MMKGNTGVADINNIDLIFMPFAEFIQEMSHASFKKKKIHHHPSLLPQMI